jgi:hypothetical protein
VGSGYDHNRNTSTIGSYGFALQAISDGLQRAAENGWVTQDEAKAEFRSHVGTIQQAEYRKEQAAALRKEADELEEMDA